MEPKRHPGPIGTSCLTCKRRRKKCDRTRPTCARCTKGGFECLGYEHLVDTTSSTSSGSRTEGITTSVRPLLPASLRSENESSDALFREVEKPTDLDLTCGLLLSGPLNENPGPYRTALALDNYNLDASDAAVPLTLGYQPLWSASNTMLGTLTPAHSSLTSTQSDSCSSSDSTQNSVYLVPRPEARAARTLSPLSPDVNYIINLSIAQHARVLGIVYFRPKDLQLNLVRKTYINRLQSSGISRCVTYIGCRAIKWFMDETSQDNRSILTNLLDQFEQKLQQVSTRPARGMNEVASRRSSFLESSFLRMRLGTGQAAYRLLQAMAPTFLQMVYGDSTLWPHRNGPPSPSLAHIFSSIHYELAHFVLTDLACAMAYGLPQVVQYDTSTPITRTDAHPMEWIYCCPPELQICLADINMRCANGYISHDWHLIEQRLMSYTPDLSDTNEPDSWRVVARLGIIESWRQALLIYLYMAVCGLASDDVRVQTAVRQIIRLSGTVKRQKPLKAKVQLVLHYLLAGICARSEKQRAYIRERLLDVLHNELWLLPGSEFVPVLDHLWHGTAANGRPIRWSDYIMSRHEALPISLA